MSDPLVSIVINNYNYADYVAGAISSALTQTYLQTEVIVVDDGSTDSSRRVIEDFGDAVTPIFKQNGGQASAVNAGVRTARGEIVLILDSDDVLLPDVVTNVVPLFADSSVVKVHWPFRYVDASGVRIRPRSGRAKPLPRGDFRTFVHENGVNTVEWSAMSANAWSRGYLRQVSPIPETLYRYGVDVYLSELSYVYGAVEALDTCHSYYRMHARQYTKSTHWSFHNLLSNQLSYYTNYSEVAERLFHSQGLTVDRERWRRNSWWCRLRMLLTEIEEVIPPEARFVIVGDKRLRAHDAFPSRCASYAGSGSDWVDLSESCEVVLDALRRLESEHVDYLVFAWPSFDWIECGAQQLDIVSAQFDCVRRNENVCIIRLVERAEQRRNPPGLPAHS